MQDVVTYAVDAEHWEKPERSNSEPAPEGRSHAGTYWLVSAFVFLLFYFFSIGPVAKVCVQFDLPAKHPRVMEAFKTIYAPIVFLGEEYPAADRFIRWYLLDVWRVPRNA